jgi:hypothetical protein
VFVDHVSPPVVLSRERLPSLSGVRTVVLGAEVLLCFRMFVVDVPIQMCLGAKSLAAALVSAYMRPVVISRVMTSPGKQL